MRRPQRVALVASAALVWASLLPLWIATYDPKLSDSAIYDAVVVLGAAIYGDKPSPVFAARLDYARDLWRSGRAQLVVVTGGVGEGEALSEAEVGRSYLAAHGVNPDAVLIEKVSRTTFENLCNAAQFVRRGEWTKVAIVSDPLHMRRASLLAGDAGLDAVMGGTPYTRYRGTSARLKFALRESYFLARRLLTGRQPCPPAQVLEPPLTATDLAVIDAEPTAQKLERLVAVPGTFRSERERASVVRAYYALWKLAEKGFGDFVACAHDSRPVWREFQRQRGRPTTLGELCIGFITEHVEALYLKKEGLGVVTASNAREWLSDQKGRTLAEMQIGALTSYRARVAERANADDRFALNTVLPDLDRRLERARGELAAGRPLTIDGRREP